MSLIEPFKWRYATKKFDPTKKVDDKTLDSILEAIRLAPTSSGLQPFKVFVITNQELKNKIVPIAYGQEIVADCSHLIVFAAWDNYTEERIEHIYDIITEERKLAKDRYDAYKDRLKANYLNRDAHLNFEHAAKQTYIAMGFAMAEAAVQKVDSTPMEGFNHEDLDKLMELEKQDLKSVLLLPIGYRDEENDWLLKLKKVRHPKSEFISYIK